MSHPDQHVDTPESNPFLVKLVSETGELVQACNGLKVQPDYSFDNAPHFDILVIPGGIGAREKEIYNKKVIQWISQRMGNVKLMTSVCTGALLLAKAGLLNGKMATTHWASYDSLENEFPVVTVKRNVKFVDEGNILAWGGVSTGINMAFHIVKQLLGSEIARTTATTMEYDITIE